MRRLTPILAHRPAGRGMRLGGKAKTTDFVEALRAEGDAVVPDVSEAAPATVRAACGHVKCTDKGTHVHPNPLSHVYTHTHTDTHRHTQTHTDTHRHTHIHTRTQEHVFVCEFMRS